MIGYRVRFLEHEPGDFVFQFLTCPSVVHVRCLEHELGGLSPVILSFT